MVPRALIVARPLIVLSAAVLILSDQPRPAHAITADLAKMCRELMVKAYPPVTAGSKHGNAQEERQYYRTCLAHGGNMNTGDQPPGQNGNAQ
jgi:hypothetical protein